MCSFGSQCPKRRRKSKSKKNNNEKKPQFSVSIYVIVFWATIIEIEILDELSDLDESVTFGYVKHIDWVCVLLN